MDLHTFPLFDGWFYCIRTRDRSLEERLMDIIPDESIPDESVLCDDPEGLSD